MSQIELSEPDYGAGRKKLGIYFLGVLFCAILTFFAFGIVRYSYFSRPTTFFILYAAALAQLLVQVICFLRLTTETPQGVNNILSFIFTLVILITIIAGSFWIMWSLNYLMIG